MAKEVFVLSATYKENDPEHVGAYDSMAAMCRGFADAIAGEKLYDLYGRGDGESKILHDFKVAIRDVARKVARLLPSLLGEEWADDECRDGKTVYGWHSLEVEGANEENDDVEKEDVEEE